MLHKYYKKNHKSLSNMVGSFIMQKRRIKYEKMDKRNCTSIYKTCKRKRLNILECSRLFEASQDDA